MTDVDINVVIQHVYTSLQNIDGKIDDLCNRQTKTENTLNNHLDMEKQKIDNKEKRFDKREKIFYMVMAVVTGIVSVTEIVRSFG